MTALKKSLNSIVRVTVVLLVMVLDQTSFAQSQTQKDSVVAEMCKTFRSTGNLPDSNRIVNIYQKHLFQFVNRFDTAMREDLATNLYFRLQKNCNEFRDVLNRLSPTHGDWEALDEKPNTTLNKTACRGFLKHKEYFYRESNDDTVRLDLPHGKWVDHFKDGTHSTLTFTWVSDCTFEIEFMESNNISRKSFSKRGDRYRYEILEKTESYYSLVVWFEGKGSYSKFKIYYH